MYHYKLPNAAAHVITVTATATRLFDLIDTAAGEAANLPGLLNAIFFSVEDGDVRITFDGTTPTAANGVLVSSGSRTYFAGVPLSKMRLIRTGASDVSISLEVGQATQGEASVMSGAGGASSTAGDVAHDAADSGNPVKIGFKAYDPASMPADVASGDRVNGVADLKGRQITYDGTYRAGEDTDIDVLKTEQRFSGSMCTADTQVKAAAGFVHSISFFCTDAAPTAGSIIIYDNTAESGTQIANLQVSTTFFNPFTIILDRIMATGIYVGFTTTADVAVQINYR